MKYRFLFIQFIIFLSKATWAEGTYCEQFYADLVEGDRSPSFVWNDEVSTKAIKKLSPSQNPLEKEETTGKLYLPPFELDPNFEGALTLDEFKKKYPHALMI